MKTNLLFLLFTVFSFAQNHHFAVKSNTVFWENSFPASFELEDLKKNFKLEFITQNSGTIKEARCKCSKMEFLMKNDFNADFRIEKTENNFKVIVFNIKFINKLDNAYGQNYRPEYFTIEEIVLKKNTEEIKDAKIVNLSLECMDEYLQNLFSSNNPK